MSGCTHGHNCCCGRGGPCPWGSSCSCHQSRHHGWHHGGHHGGHHGSIMPPSIHHYWARGEYGCAPPNAVHVGHDKGGDPIYAGRAYHDGDLLPAKVTPRHGCAYVSFAGKEHKKNDYEVLCCNGGVSWAYDRDGRVPMHALCVGRTRGGEELYMGRASHDGTLTPGKIHPSNRVLYIPYDGREISFSQYEVLLLRPF